MNRKYLIVIAGPTASGKSKLAIDLALHYHCEIVSADSRQVYREMNAGVAKPDPLQMATVPHHLIGHVSIHDAYNAGIYEQEALHVLDELYSRRDIAILAGGTGLYIHAVLEGFDVFPEISPDIINRLKNKLEEQGPEALQNDLKQKDPEYYARVDIHNPHRLIRALAVIESAGLPYSQLRKQRKKTRPFIPIPLLLSAERNRLYQRINQRVDEMVNLGLKEEALTLYPFRHLNSLQTVGYQEWFDHFEGKLTEAEAIDKIKQHTRNYAKRQWTWFRRTGWPEFGTEEVEKIIAYIDSMKGGPEQNSNSSD